MSPLARLLAAFVTVYRATLSPLLGPRCRFEPSCSSYALEALRTHGAMRGSLLTGWRLLRCQPLGTAGYDPVPPAHTHLRPHLGRPTRGARAC